MAVKLKPTLPVDRDDLINFEVNAEERAAIQAKADKYTRGNMSAWLRYSAINLEPKKSDLISDKFSRSSPKP